jgi:hypothetical protein
MQEVRAFERKQLRADILGNQKQPEAKNKENKAKEQVAELKDRCADEVKKAMKDYVPSLVTRSLNDHWEGSGHAFSLDGLAGIVMKNQSKCPAAAKVLETHFNCSPNGVEMEGETPTFKDGKFVAPSVFFDEFEKAVPEKDPVVLAKKAKVMQQLQAYHLQKDLEKKKKEKKTKQQFVASKEASRLQQTLLAFHSTTRSGADVKKDTVEKTSKDLREALRKEFTRRDLEALREELARRDLEEKQKGNTASGGIMEFLLAPTLINERSS